MGIVTEVCGGKCVDGRKMVDGKCVLPPHTWKCDGIIQSVSTPCYGLCKNPLSLKWKYPTMFSVVKNVFIDGRPGTVMGNACIFLNHAMENVYHMINTP